jgi:hypothetical protein
MPGIALRNGRPLLTSLGDWAVECCCTGEDPLNYWCFGYDLDYPDDLIQWNPFIARPFPDKVLTQVVFSASGFPSIWTVGDFYRNGGSAVCGFNNLYNSLASMSSFNRSYVIPVHADFVPPDEPCYGSTLAGEVGTRPVFHSHEDVENIFPGTRDFLSEVPDAWTCGPGFTEECGLLPDKLRECCSETFDCDFLWDKCLARVGPFWFDGVVPVTSGSFENRCRTIGAPDPGNSAFIAAALPIERCGDVASYFKTSRFRRLGPTKWTQYYCGWGDFKTTRTLNVTYERTANFPYNTPARCQQVAIDYPDETPIPPTVTTFTVTYTCTPTWSDPPTP